MEEGRLTDSFGRNIDFRNTILIMTTNAGAEAIKNEAAFGFAKPDQDATYESMKTRVTEEIEKVFRPEFINRVNDIIVFRHLNDDDMKHVVELELARSATGSRKRASRSSSPTRPRNSSSRRARTPTTVPGRCGGRSRRLSKTRWPRSCSRASSPARTSIRIEVKKVGDKKQLVFEGRSTKDQPASRSRWAPARAPTAASSEHAEASGS